MSAEPATPLTEAEVHQLRANIYGECSDGNWGYCKDAWMEPQNVKWLLDHQPKKVEDSAA